MLFKVPQVVLVCRQGCDGWSRAGKPESSYLSPTQETLFPPALSPAFQSLNFHLVDPYYEVDICAVKLVQNYDFQIENIHQSWQALYAIFIILRPNCRACATLNRLHSFQAGHIVLTERLFCQSCEKTSEEKQLRQFGGCFQGAVGISLQDFPKWKETSGPMR